jgi:hypothetical protein
MRITIPVAHPHEDDVGTQLLGFLGAPELVREMEERLVAERNKSHLAASGRPHVVHDGPLGAHIQIIEWETRRDPSRPRKHLKGIVGCKVDELRPDPLLQSP